MGIASVGAIGIGINLFAIWKLSFGQDKAERHCFHHLLLSLSICDLTHIIFNFICFALPHLSEAYRENVLLYTIPFLIPLAQMSLSCSSFTTVVSDFMLFYICIYLIPSSIYSCFIGHILGYVFCHLGCWAVLWKIFETTKILLKYATFEGRKKITIFFKNIL